VQFKDVINQKNIQQKLISMYRDNRLSHALLFLGKEGNGALSLARAFAQFIVCEKVNNKADFEINNQSLFEAPSNKSDTQEELNDSCGICPACKKASKLIHPDIHFSYPTITKKSGEKPKATDFIEDWRSFASQHPYGNNFDWLQAINAENKQGNISATECEDIAHKLHLKSYEAEYKILIMWMPEFLGKEGNKLLKLIEEPPPNTLFIFVAENEDLILPTILSRTQLIKVPALTANEIKNSLINKMAIEPTQATEISEICDGNYREALELLQQVENNWETFLRDWLNTIVKTGPAAQVKWIEEVGALGREKQKQFLKYFNHLLQQSIRLSILGGGDGNNQRLANINDFAARFNRLCDISQLEAIIQDIDNSIYHIERNANAKIVFHSLTIRIYHIISNKSVILMS
jgi:DNA polymerase-3 subunit delta'